MKTDGHYLRVVLLWLFFHKGLAVVRWGLCGVNTGEERQMRTHSLLFVGSISINSVVRLVCTAANSINFQVLRLSFNSIKWHISHANFYLVSDPCKLHSLIRFALFSNRLSKFNSSLWRGELKQLILDFFNAVF